MFSLFAKYVAHSIVMVYEHIKLRYMLYGTRTILNFIRLFHPPTYSHIKLMIIAKNIPKRNEFILYLDDDDCPNNEGV